jgi:hypothetical protein
MGNKKNNTSVPISSNEDEMTENEDAVPEANSTKTEDIVELISETMKQRVKGKVDSFYKSLRENPWTRVPIVLLFWFPMLCVAITSYLVASISDLIYYY